MTNHLQRDNWIDYLRSAITVLVVAHHCSLAYTTFAAFDANAYISSTHPVVDARRWIGLDIFENFNDIFFMSLMFFIGGLFLTKSIARKGVVAFIKDRFLRLLLPFMISVSLFMLIAHFPAYYLAHHSWNVADYVVDFFTIEQWPVGPPWFIWVLFAFNTIFAVTYPLLRSFYSRTGKVIQSLGERPLLFIGLFILITWLTYVPTAMIVGMGTWTGWGPFDFQLSRVMLYFAYFILGTIVGSDNFQQGLFAETAALTRKWKLWIVLAFIAYSLITINTIYEPLRQLALNGSLSPIVAYMIYFTVYVCSCVCSCLAFLTTFRAKCNNAVPLMDSLSANAYLIYLIHYIFVIWSQFALLDVPLPAIVKFSLSFSSSVGLSWGLSILLRRIKIIQRYA
ncbi:acyltransferase family protein [Chitinophaga agri]|uniref:Acyltransferase n=1 Tax=Chitinophaga agri TaxID=2703787 RepID=A0A6B9ZQG2_9BACT|nr:acyltransferase [Chitinophaga agri]QHS63715.1 acyltransferase [Chitinophaga agri]